MGIYLRDIIVKLVAIIDIIERNETKRIFLKDVRLISLIEFGLYRYNTYINAPHIKIIIYTFTARR
jgi:hypothetical protein